MLDDGGGQLVVLAGSDVIYQEPSLDGVTVHTISFPGNVELNAKIGLQLAVDDGQETLAQSRLWSALLQILRYQQPDSAPTQVSRLRPFSHH